MYEPKKSTMHESVNLFLLTYILVNTLKDYVIIHIQFI